MRKAGKSLAHVPVTINAPTPPNIAAPTGPKNRATTPANFLSANSHFCRSALARYTPADFSALLQRHRVKWHEKHKGQLFCDESSDDIIAMLLRTR